MDDTSPVSGSGAPTTPTSVIVTRGIFIPSMSTQKTNVVQSTIIVTTNSIASSIVEVPLEYRVQLHILCQQQTISQSMDMLNVLVSSQPTSQLLNVGAGSTQTPYHPFSWGGGHIPLSSPFVRSGHVIFSIPNPAWVWGTSMGSESQLLVCHQLRPCSHFMVG
jgi:hypothetical protein